MELNMIKNCVYSIPCSCSKIYKGESGRLLKVRLKEHRKAVGQGEIEKPGMVDNIWTEKGNHRRLKESAHMLGYNDLLKKPTIELNTILKPIIKKTR